VIKARASYINIKHPTASTITWWAAVVEIPPDSKLIGELCVPSHIAHWDSQGAILGGIRSDIAVRNRM